MEQNTNISYNLIDLIIYLFKNKKPIILVTIAGFVASVVISLVITPEYKAGVVLFPSSNGSISKALISESITRTDIYKLGDEEDAEQLLQILNSDAIKDKIINKYNLFDHYDVSRNSAFPNTQVTKIFQSNVKFNKTRFQSIEITVLDKDPQMASAIANDICDLVDTVYNIMVYQRAQEALQIVENEFAVLKDSIKSIETELQQIKQAGLIDPLAEAQSYTDAYTSALVNGKMNNNIRAEFDKKFEVLAKYGARFGFLVKLLEEQSEKYSNMEMHLAEAKMNANNTISRKFVLNRAYPPEKKSYPVRWLIVVLGTFSSFLFSLFLIFSINIYKQTKLKLISE